MSDREGSYSLPSSLMGYNSNQPRPASTNQSVLAPRRAARASYRPALSPPPSIALPPTPSLVPAPTNGSHRHQHQQHPQLSLRVSNQSPVASGRGYTSSHHPYSAHSLASTPDIDNDLSDGFSSSNERNYRKLYRSQAHQSPVSTNNSQAQSLNYSARLQTSMSNSSIHQKESDLAYASTSSPVKDHSAGVSPGSYFAAYPPASGPLPRDRSDSEASLLSPASSSHTASASAMSPVYDPPLTAHRSPPPPPASSSRTKDQPSSSSSHRHGSSSQKSRPSSRRALTAALELAKSAVLLDQTNDDPRGAVQAYANTVRLLSEVMDRVMRGDDPPSSSAGAAGASSGTEASPEDRRRRGRRKSNVVAKEEEVRRLKAIHDTYADRLTILCLIYSIPPPSPLGRTLDGSISDSAPSDQPNQTKPPAAVPSEPQGPIGSTVSFGDSDQETPSFPDAPEDITQDDLSSTEQEDPAADTATIRRGHQHSGTDNELDYESEREQRALYKEGSGIQVDTSFSAYRQQQQNQNQYPSPVTDKKGFTYSEDSDNAETPRRVRSGSNATPHARGISQDPPAPMPSSISLSAFRNSVLPPPRPPPSGPLPTRPRIASGTSIPTQLLNQPLPPLPPVPNPQPPPETPASASQHVPPVSQPHANAHTLTRQSSASSVSAVSGASSNTSGSSSASTFLASQLSNVNPLLPSGLTLASAPVSQPPVNSTLSPPATRSRGNSNAHARSLSNAERLGAVNEEKEEDEGTIRKGATPIPPSTTPPQEHKYRSRSSSMVSLKDRDRAKAQVLGALSQAPLPPLPGPQKRPSAENLLEPLPSPNAAVFGAKASPRTRGSSIGSSATHTSDDYIASGGSPSTTPVGTIPYTAGGAPAPGSAPIVVPGAAGGSALDSTVKLNPNTKEGTISQRRSQASQVTSGGSQSGHTKLTSAVLPAATATSLGLTGRNRSSSNPGKWQPGMDLTSRPPMPPPPMSAGPRRHFPTPSVVRYQSFGLPSPSGSANASTVSLVPTVNGAPIAGVPISTLPPAPPALAILRPYHLMTLLRKSISDRSGGYITPRLHVPHEVWTQGSAKLTNTAEKTRVIDVLVAALEELANASVDFCGTSSGIVTSTGGGEKKQGEKWASKLEDFERAFTQLGVTFGKKLGVGEGFVAKKSMGMAAWSNKFLDKIGAVGKPNDSPAAYAGMLTKLFTQVQLLDEHSRASHMSPQPPAYASLPPEVRNRIEASLKNLSELFAKIVLTFVFRDLSLMLDKYHKTCDKWIQSNPGNPPF